MQISIDTGLSAVEIGQMPSGDAYAVNVENDVETVESLEITSAPFFIIEGKFGISRAQPTEMLTDGLQQAWLMYEQETNQKFKTKIK